MAKVQADKTKGGLGGFFGLGGSKAKTTDKTGRTGPVGSSTATNIPAAGGPTTTNRAKAAPAQKKPAAKRAGGVSLANFRLPIIGSKPLTAQMQVLGSAALFF